jgi:hypothetical protein
MPASIENTAMYWVFIAGPPLFAVPTTIAFATADVRRDFLEKCLVLNRAVSLSLVVFYILSSSDPA